MIGGLWLPAVAGIERTPVYIGDYERAVSGVLRTAHVGKAMEWRVLLQGVASEDVEALEEVLRSPVPVGCNIMGTEVIASVTELSSAHNPKRHGPDADWGRMNYEILVSEVVVEQIMPGFTYEYQAFTDTGAFTWDWDAAGQPDEVDVLLVAGGGGGGGNGGSAAFGYGGGGAGGVRVITDFPVSGNVSGSVGAGGAAGSNGSNSVFGGQSATGGGAGANSANGSAGGSGGGARESGAPGAGTSGQGHAGGPGSAQMNEWLTSSAAWGGGGGGGGVSAAGAAGGPPQRRGGHGGAGGTGVDLLSLGWNYRLALGAPRYVGGGGGGGAGHRQGPSYSGDGAGGPGGVGGGGAGGGERLAEKAGGEGQPNTGGGGGGGGGGG